jgi:hypothetical protein
VNRGVTAVSETIAVTEETDAGLDDANRRVFRRLPASALPALSARLGGGVGTEVRLIDLSRGGARFESETRLLPGSTVAIRLVTPDSTIVMVGRVVRSRVARLEHGGLGYDAAISFEKPLKDLIDEPGDSLAPPVVVQPTSSAQRDFDLSARAETEPVSSGAMVTVTAAVSQSSDELQEMFNGNEW